MYSLLVSRILKTKIIYQAKLSQKVHSKIFEIKYNVGMLLKAARQTFQRSTADLSMQHDMPYQKMLFAGLAGSTCTSKP